MIDSKKLRNIALLGHNGVGKTSLCEAMLFAAGAVTRLGKVEDGNTVMDFAPEETKKGFSITSSIAHLDWRGHRINLIDTPGFMDFLPDTRACLRAVDAAIVVVSAVSGVEVGTGKVWKFCEEQDLPRMLVVNVMDRENADFGRAVESIQKSFGNSAFPVMLPIGAEQDFKGVVDLLHMKAYLFDNGQAVETVIPDEMKDEIEQAREGLIEAAAEGDDSLTEKYLEEGELSGEEIIAGLRAGIHAGSAFPILCAAATAGIGIGAVMELVVDFLPSPADAEAVTGTDPGSEQEVQRKPDPAEPFSAYVFKTFADDYAGRITIFRIMSGTLKADSGFYNAVSDQKERFGSLYHLQGKKQDAVTEAVAGDIVAVVKLQNTNTGDTLCDESAKIVYPKTEFPRPVISYAIQPKSKGDEEKISTAIQKLLEEDPVLHYERHAETHEMILSGMGASHVEATIEKMKRKFGVEVTLDIPEVPYKETITKRIEKKYRHKKQSGGRGQFAECVIVIEPVERSEGFEFVDKIFGGSIPRQFVPAVEKGVVEAMNSGVVAGYPVVDVRVEVNDGMYHPVDSSELAFKIAGSQAFKAASKEAGPILLEPIVAIEVITPEDNMGDVIGDLNSRRGRIQGMERQGDSQVVRGQVPLAEVLKYASDLTSMTSGRGTFSMEFDHYEPVPARQVEEIMKARAKEEEE